MKDKIILTDNGKRLLTYMQEHDQVWVGKDLVDLTNIKGIYPVLNSLIFNGLVIHSEPISRVFVNARGQKKNQEYKTYVLTELGRNYQIED